MESCHLAAAGRMKLWSLNANFFFKSTVGIGDQGGQRAKMRRAGGFQAKDLLRDLRNGEVDT